MQLYQKDSSNSAPRDVHENDTPDVRGIKSSSSSAGSSSKSSNGKKRRPHLDTQTSSGEKKSKMADDSGIDTSIGVELSDTPHSISASSRNTRQNIKRDRAEPVIRNVTPMSIIQQLRPNQMMDQYVGYDSRTVLGRPRKITKHRERPSKVYTTLFSPSHSSPHSATTAATCSGGGIGDDIGATQINHHQSTTSRPIARLLDPETLDALSLLSSSSAEPPSFVDLTEQHIVLAADIFDVNTLPPSPDISPSIDRNPFRDQEMHLRNPVEDIKSKTSKIGENYPSFIINSPSRKIISYQRRGERSETIAPSDGSFLPSIVVSPATVPLRPASQVAIDTSSVSSISIAMNDSDAEEDDESESFADENHRLFASQPSVVSARRERPPLWKSTISLCNTILGTGIVTLPYAFAAMGFFPGIILLGICALATWFSLHLLVSSSLMAHTARTVREAQSGGVNPTSFNFLESGAYPTYGYLAKVAFGPRYAAAVDFAMAFGCFGFAVSCIISIRDCMPKMFAFLVPLWGADNLAVQYLTDGYLWTLLFLVMLIPLSLARSVDDFWWFDGACLISVGYLGIVVILWALFNPEYSPSDVLNPPTSGGLTWDDISKQLEVLPVFFFAFSCQQNVFTIYEEVGFNYNISSVVHIRKVIDYAVICTAFLYMLVGVAGYYSFGPGSEAVILDNFPDPNAWYLVVGRLMFCLLAALSFPFQLHPCRQAVDSFFTALGVFPVLSATTKLSRGVVDEGHEEDGIDDDKEIYPTGNNRALTTRGGYTLISGGKFGLGLSIRRFGEELVNFVIREPGGRSFTVTLSLVGLAYAVAFFVTRLDETIALVGATGGTLVCYILPPLFFRALLPTGPSVDQKEALLCLILMGAGVVFGVLGIVYNVAQFSSISP